MLVLRFSLPMLRVGCMLLAAGAVCGQDYPTKAVRIFTAGIGGGTDLVARLVAQGIAGSLGQSVVVENRGGALSGELAAKAPPDGYTLLIFGGSLWIGPLTQKVPYDPVKDFSPITLVSISPQVLVVHPSLPVRSVKELIALAKARPGELNYASGQTGATSHLAGALFTHMANVNIVRVPYSSNSQQLADLISGQVQLSFTSATQGMPHVKLGRLRALAVTSAKPFPLVPGLPPAAQSGLPGYEMISINGMFAPAKTPDAIIRRLNQEVVRLFSQSDIKQRFFDSGEEAVGSSPEEFAATIKSEMAKFGRVIKDAGIKAE